MNEKIYSFTLIGRFQFPIDLMRLDKCWPASKADANKIIQSIKEISNDIIEIEINCFSSQLTEEKWAEEHWLLKSKVESSYGNYFFALRMSGEK